MKKFIIGLLLAFSGNLHANEDPELMCLAKNIFHEARGESIEGQIAVGIVTLNRVRSDKYPNNVCDVVYQPYQFSWTLKKAQIKNWKLYHRIKDLAHLLLNNEVVSDVGDALFYHASTIPDPRTGKKVHFEPFWAPEMLQVAVIDNHIFYQEP